MLLGNSFLLIPFFQIGKLYRTCCAEQKEGAPGRQSKTRGECIKFRRIMRLKSKKIDLRIKQKIVNKE